MHGDGGGSILNKEVFLVVDGRIGDGTMVYGAYDTEKQAEKAIAENDPRDSYLCHIVDLHRNVWLFPPVDV